MADSSPTRPPKIQLAEVAAKASAQARIGTVVSGRYRLTDVLAMGGVGVVYKAEHVHMRKWVAIKVLHPDAQNAPDLVARFHREAVAGAHIQHPHVTAATDFGELEDGSFFLVLEFVRGATLREILQRGALPARRAVSIARQLAEALTATHAIGIVHRDVTPRNVMVVEGEGERDFVKLIDFGLAKLDNETLATAGASRDSAHDLRITATGAVFGTIAYLAPEVALGMDSFDARADLYALGLVMYEMLSGKHPFATTDAVVLFKHHAASKPPPIAERSPGVEVLPALEAVVMRLLEKLPDARYASAEETIAALDAAVEGTLLSPTPSPVAYASRAPPPMSTPPSPVAIRPSLVPSFAPPAAPTAPARAPRRTGVFAVAALAACGLAAAAFWWSRSPPAPPKPALAAAPTAPEPIATAAPAKPPETVIAPAPPPPSASAPEPARTAAPVGSPDPASRALLRNAVGARDFKHGVEPFLALVERDAAAFRDPTVATAARDLVVALASGAADEATALFDALATRLGGDGVDILYEIVRTRGGSKAALRAQELLKKPEVIARATPALRVTYDLGEASCQDKLGLLDRATREGDIRTLLALEAATKACFRHNQAVEDAQKALRQRLSARPAP